MLPAHGPSSPGVTWLSIEILLNGRRKKCISYKFLKTMISLTRRLEKMRVKEAKRIFFGNRMFLMGYSGPEENITGLEKDGDNIRLRLD